jgi:hypothetical protein
MRNPFFFLQILLLSDGIFAAINFQQKHKRNIEILHDGLFIDIGARTHARVLARVFQFLFSATKARGKRENHHNSRIVQSRMHDTD